MRFGLRPDVDSIIVIISASVECVDIEVVIVIISTSCDGEGSNSIVEVLPDSKKRTLGVHPLIIAISERQLLGYVGAIIMIIARLATRCGG